MRYAAFIRGINVGRAKRVAMSDLQAMLVDVGLAEVSTLLNSGNAAFTADDSTASVLSQTLENALSARLGVGARVVVVSSAELDAVVSQNPLVDGVRDPSRLLVAFPADRVALESMSALSQREWDPEACEAGEHAGYLWCPDGVAASRLAAALATTLGDSVTSRSWTTVLRMQAKLHEGDGAT
jgi:uncharacterized protein (DUF1697 family)